MTRSSAFLHSQAQGRQSTAMKFDGNVCSEVQVNFLALSASKTHIFVCGALKKVRIFSADIRLNFRHSKSVSVPEKRVQRKGPKGGSLTLGLAASKNIQSDFSR